MKSLQAYINESISNHDFDKFAECALSAIDYYYNEGVREYSDDNIEAYVNGDKEPNYKKVIKDIIAEMKHEIPNNVMKELNKYPNCNDKEDIEMTILQTFAKLLPTF
jgi:hypothetical protein